MRKYIFLAGLVFLAINGFRDDVRADEALSRLDGDVIARVHFLGTAAISARPEAMQLDNIAELPVSRDVVQKTLDKLATAPFRLLHGKLAEASQNNDFAPLLRPLLNDLLTQESFLELRDPAKAVPEIMLAVHLDNSRAQIWQDSLAKVLASWTGIAVKPIRGDGFSGWELRKHLDPNLICCLRAGDWLLFAWGQDEIKSQTGVLQRIKAHQRPVEVTSPGVLDVSMDWPAFERMHKLGLPSFLPAPLPKMHLTVEMQKEYLRPRLIMQFSQPLGIKLDRWQLPTNTIKNPIVSFTAARGIEPWLNSLPDIKNLHAPTIPNQMVIWARDGVPFETSFAMPVAGASNYLDRIQAPLVQQLNTWAGTFALPSQFAYSRGEINFAGMPVMAPYIRALNEPTGDYLTGGAFVPSFNKYSKPLPAELVQEVDSKPNLVCYDWELNSPRIKQWGSLINTYLMIKGKVEPSPNLPAQRWIAATTNKFGNCATEITLTAPNELSATRNGVLGLTGLEINLLAVWLDAPDFPFSYDYGMAPTPGSKRLKATPAH